MDMNIYKVGQRVAIDLDMDSIKINGEVHMGTVTSIKQDERRMPGTLFHPWLITCQGDDGEEYASIKYSSGMSPFTFVTRQMLLDYILMRNKEILKELDAMKQFENQFTEEMSYRAMHGMDYKVVQRNYAKCMAPIVKYIKESSQRTTYLQEKVFVLFLDDGEDNPFLGY